MEDYLKLLRGIYDFNSLSHLLRRPDFKFTFDGMHGVAGPYAKRILVKARQLSPTLCRPSPALWLLCLLGKSASVLVLSGFSCSGSATFCLHYGGLPC